MLDRIVVNVVGVASEVGFVTQRVLPVTPLPDATLAFGGAAFRDPLAAVQAVGECRFYEPPAQCKVGITAGEKSRLACR